jgi:hypothetical protein
MLPQQPYTQSGTWHAVDPTATGMQRVLVTHGVGSEVPLGAIPHHRADAQL